MQELLTFLAQSLVEHPEQVVVRKTESSEATLFELEVAQEDMGRVIGKQGRIAKSIRTLMKAAAPRDGRYVDVDIHVAAFLRLGIYRMACVDAGTLVTSVEGYDDCFWRRCFPADVSQSEPSDRPNALVAGPVVLRHR